MLFWQTQLRNGLSGIESHRVPHFNSYILHPRCILLFINFIFITYIIIFMQYLIFWNPKTTFQLRTHPQKQKKKKQATIFTYHPYPLEKRANFEIKGVRGIIRP